MLEAVELFKKYPGGARALQGVSISLHSGETLGLAGESGCGKSTLGKLLIRLEEPDSGSVLLNGTDYTKLTGEKMRSLRRKIQMVFQDTFGSLNPRLTVAQTLSEPLNNYFTLSDKDKKEQIRNLLEMVGLQLTHCQRYPHELSGGQRQRVVIARALSVQPEWIICDEPVSSLDVLIQQQILKLFEQIKEQKK
jgi:oligopeptide transport system ATP-binding protein